MGMGRGKRGIYIKPPLCSAEDGLSLPPPVSHLPPMISNISSTTLTPPCDTFALPAWCREEATWAGVIPSILAGRLLCK